MKFKNILMPSYLVGLLVFLTQVSQNSLSVGSIVAKSSMENGLKKTAIIVGVQAIAALLALIWNSLGNKFNVNSANRIKMLFAAWISSSIFLSLTATESILWHISLLFRASCSAWFLSFLFSSVPLIADKEIEVTNRNVQNMSVVGVLIGCCIGPLVSTYSKFEVLFLIDIFWTGTIFMITVISRIKNIVIRKQNLISVNSSSETLINKKIIHVIYLTFYVWAISGVFQIIEVPILKRLNFSAEAISLVFLVTLTFNFLAIRLLPIKLTNLWSKNTLFYSAMLLVAASNAYLFANSWIYVMVIISVIGFANGMFNLSQSTIIQKISDSNERIKGFILVRLVSQIALLVGVLISYFASPGSISEILLIATLVLLLPIVMSLSKRKSGYAIFVLTLILFVVGKAYASANRVKIPITSIPKRIYPPEIIDGSSGFVHGQIFENLYEYSSDNTIVPNIAKSHLISNDAKSIEITLRHEKTFSDGSPLSADDVVFALKKSIFDLKKESAWAFGEVIGFEKFISEKKFRPDLLKIYKLAANKIKIQFSKPFSLMPQILTAPNFAIFKMANEMPIGTGSYELDNMSRVHIRLRKRLDPKSPLIGPDTIDFIEEPNTESAVQNLARNEYDIIPFVANAKEIPFPYREISYRYLQTVIIIFNLESEIFKDRKLRCQFGKFFAEANKESNKEWQPISVGLPFSWEFVKPQSDERDKNIIQSKNINLYFADSMAVFNQNVNDKILQSLDSKGFKVNFQRAKIGELIKSIKEKKIDAGVLGFVPDYAHPDALLYPLLVTDQQYNFNKVSIPEVDKNLSKARETTDKIQQIKLYKKVFEKISDDCPVVFVGASRGKAILSSKWEDFEFPQLGFYRFKLKNLKLR